MVKDIQKRYLAMFDELNNLVTEVVDAITDNSTLAKEKPLDLIEEMMIDAYVRGHDDVNEMLDTLEDVSADETRKALEKVIGGQTTSDRVNELITSFYNKAQEPAVSDISAEVKRLLETEMHRMYSAGQSDCANRVADSGANVLKTWITVGDEKVRDTHDFVEGVTKPLGEPFYTYDGDSAMYPGDFELASNNVNCRCWLEYSLGEQA